MKVTRGGSLAIVPLRFISYLCLPLALVFLSGFLETSTTIEHPEERLFFKRFDKKKAEEISTTYKNTCGNAPVRISPDQLIDLQMLRSSSGLSVSDWDNIRKNIFDNRMDKLCLIEKDIVYALSTEQSTPDSTLPRWVRIHFTQLGPIGISDIVPRLSKKHFVRYPELEAILAEIDHRPDYDTIRLSFEHIAIPVRDWKMFAETVPGLEYPEAAFLYGNHFYRATVKTKYSQGKEQIPGRKKTHMITGVILLVAGLLPMPKLYRSARGIKLVPNKLILLMDIMIILVMAGLGYLALTDYYDPLIDYNKASFMGLQEEGMLGAISYLMVLVIMPIAVSWQAVKGILVDEQGVLESGLLMNSFLPWDELKKMETMDDIEFSGRRRSFKVLFLYGDDDDFVTIPGNMRAPAKKDISRLLLHFAPENRKHELKMHLSSL